MRNKVITLIFITALVAAAVLNIFTPDSVLSFSERRTLYGWEDLGGGDGFSEDFEKYALDQFVLRDLFRKIKAFAEYRIFIKNDNNGLYRFDDFIIKMLYPLNESSVGNLADKINAIYDMYLDGNRVFYSLIPDKNYFTDTGRYITIDYDRMTELLKDGVYDDVSYIDIFDTLNLDDYYRTDHHYRMDSLDRLITRLSEAMDHDISYDADDYIRREFYPFYGAYYGQASMDIDADTLVYLENELLKNITVTIFESFSSSPSYNGVYDYEKLGSIDSYDMFLYGTKPILTIENPEAGSDRELIVFKDSFSNSLVPLMVGSYSKITLVDLRLVNHTVLDSFIEFGDADVLFLYSTMVANDSYILK